MSTLQHRHYVKIAEIIAKLPVGVREQVANHFAWELRGTNPQYDQGRFAAAASGAPYDRRDKIRQPNGATIR
jgi:hypothetical protein